ncbi:MAG: hypothetical protein Q7T87_10980 [Polaromonas sp.]|nr:hypothetical protein [Polaromonas sp.]
MTTVRVYLTAAAAVWIIAMHHAWAAPRVKARVDVQKLKSPMTSESYFPDGGCRFRWLDLYGTGFGGDLLSASTLGGGGLQMICRHSDYMNDPEKADAIFNQKTQEWELYFSKDDEEFARPVTSIYALQAVNSSGFAINQDQINGEEERWDRSLHFCLIRPPRALCGGGWVARLVDGPKGDMTQLMLEMLSKIEFIEKPGDALPEPPPPPPPPPPIVIPCPVEERNEQGFCKSKEWSRSDLR